MIGLLSNITLTVSCLNVWNLNHSLILFILPLNGHPVQYLCFQAKLDGISSECHFRPLNCYAV